MNTKAKRFSPSTLYRFLITLTGIAFLLFATLRYPIERWEGLILVFFVPILTLLPVGLGPTEVSLIHVLTLGSGLLFGPTIVAWVISLGVFLGYFLRYLAWNFLSQPQLPRPNRYLDAGFVFGSQVIPLVLSFSLANWTQGYDGLQTSWPNVLYPLLLFPIIHYSLYLIIVHLEIPPIYERRRILLELFLVNAIPLPFLGIGPTTYSASPLGVLALLGGVPIALAGLLYSMNITRLKLERRVQELSTIANISRVLRSTLNLEELLTVIHQQVTQFLKVSNFYVALYDSKKNMLTYPLAVKAGVRCHWQPCPLDPKRLTGRVIHEGKPLLITPENRAVLQDADLPASSESTEAWAGVPLITSERTIGCLAVFSMSPNAQFTQADLDLLSILSGQVSVAIENVLLYEQAQSRASQLEALNHIMALITASLDTQEVLAQVCKSIINLVGGQHSAVYLFDEEQDHCLLAYTEHLSKDFVQQNNELSIVQENRRRYLYSDHPVILSNIKQSTLPNEYLKMLSKEGIQALADFPLATPDGRIGLLSVYYDQPHAFTPEEIELVQSLAYQTALAASKARLFSAADKTLARRADQLAILENVGRELAAALNSPRLFEMILDYALRFTNSPWGCLSLYDSLTNTLEVKAYRGYRKVDSRYPVEGTLSGKTVITRQPVRIKDSHNIPEYVDLTDGAAHSQLSIPLIHEERVLGVLTLESDRPNAYSENDQTFIAQLATQAAVAVVNAELYNEIQKRLREQSILYQVGSRLVASPELDNVMQTAVQAMENTLPASIIGAYLFNEDKAAYMMRAATAHPDYSLPKTIPEKELSGLEKALRATALIHLEPGRQDVTVLFKDLPSFRAVVFPIVVKRQRLGMLILYADAQKSFQEEDLQIMHAIAAQISISLQNALLFQRISHGLDQLAAVLNSVNDGLLMLDRSGKILLVNQALQQMMRLEEEQIIDQFVAELPVEALHVIGYTSEQAENLTKRIDQHKSTATAKATFNITDPKPEKVVERSVLPVLAQEGQAIGWMIVLRDITEEAQVSQARELITETLVHDLRSPVSAVLSAVDILENTLPNEQKKDELISQALRVAYNSANRVLGLVESLLDIAKLKAGRMELYTTSFDITALLINTLNDFMPQANEMGVILRHDLTNHSLIVFGDQSKIMRVLTNLLDNALKFTPAGGQVLVSIDEKAFPNTVAIQVSDTGPGIPEEFRETIFERFTQIPGQKGRRRGSGLGLTFCKLAIEAHGGKIWVSPRSEGGSIFSFTLPIKNAEGERPD